MAIDAPLSSSTQTSSNRPFSNRFSWQKTRRQMDESPPQFKIGYHRSTPSFQIAHPTFNKWIKNGQSWELFAAIDAAAPALSALHIPISAVKAEGNVPGRTTKTWSNKRGDIRAPLWISSIFFGLLLLLSSDNWSDYKVGTFNCEFIPLLRVQRPFKLVTHPITLKFHPRFDSQKMRRKKESRKYSTHQKWKRNSNSNSNNICSNSRKES